MQTEVFTIGESTTICRHNTPLQSSTHSQTWKTQQSNLQCPNDTSSTRPKDNPNPLVEWKIILTSNQCLIQVVYTYILTGIALPCHVILQGFPFAVSVEPVLLLLFSCFMCDIQESASTTISVSLNCIASEKELERREKQTGWECTCGPLVMKNTDSWKESWLSSNESTCTFLSMVTLSSYPCHEISGRGCKSYCASNCTDVYQRLDSALDASRPAQHKCKKDVRGLHSRRLLPKVVWWVLESVLLFHFHGSIVDPYATDLHLDCYCVPTVERQHLLVASTSS